jgi:hypothetical protein
MAEDRSRGNRYARLLFEPSSVDPKSSVDIFQRWNLAADDLDAKQTAKRLDELWRSWNFGQRMLLLETAESIVKADAARAEWKLDPRQKQRCAEIADRCSAAARLGRRLLQSFPPPWQADQSSIGELIVSLVDFAVSGLDVTAILDHDMAKSSAAWALRELNKKTPKHQRASNALIADLV